MNFVKIVVSFDYTKQQQQMKGPRQKMRRLTNFLKEEIESFGIDTTWMRLLKTHTIRYAAQNKVEDFSNHDDFKNYDVFDEDLLEGLSLAEISTLFEYSLSIHDRAGRKNAGAYFTPEDVADFMAEQAFRLDFSGKGCWLDPAAGVGNLSYALALIQDDPEDFVLNRLILQDLNPVALKVAQTLFALRFQKNTSNFYEKISSRFIVKDFLQDYDKSSSLGLELPQPGYDSQEVDYNYVIVNPPYLASKIDNRFITSKSRDVYAYFLEKIILSSEGFVSVTPQSFLNSKKFEDLRELFIDNFDNCDFYAFDNIPDSVFKGYKYGSNNTNSANSVRAAITVASKHGTDSKKHYRITPFLRWQTAEREEAFEKFSDMLTAFNPEKGKIFPKISAETSEFYSKILNNKTVSSLLVAEETVFCLNIPCTPRYYISATKRTLNRGSLIKAYFKNKEDLQYAYMLLNSPYFYWWWRVTDGGLTLSKTTLNSLPLLDFAVDDSLVELLEAEELTNVTVKINAGISNENVKHSPKLVKSLGELVLQNQALSDELLKFSQNSFLEK